MASPAFIEFEAWQAGRVPVVTLTGYDLNAPFRAALFERDREIDVSNSVSHPGPYQAILNLGVTGIPLTLQSLRVVVSTDGALCPGPGCSTITIVHLPRICREFDFSTRPSEISLLPGHSRGDRDFDGAGPQVSVRVTIIPSFQNLDFQVEMVASETEDDWTTVAGVGRGTLGLNPPLPAGIRIVYVNGSTTSDAQYVDSNHENDTVAPSTGGPVSLFTFVGDTDGDDVGRTRLVSASFNLISLHLVEVGDCVPRVR